MSFNSLHHSFYKELCNEYMNKYVWTHYIKCVKGMNENNGTFVVRV